MDMLYGVAAITFAPGRAAHLLPVVRRWLARDRHPEVALYVLLPLALVAVAAVPAGQPSATIRLLLLLPAGAMLGFVMPLMDQVDRRRKAQKAERTAPTRSRWWT